MWNAKNENPFFFWRLLNNTESRQRTQENAQHWFTRHFSFKKINEDNLILILMDSCPSWSSVSYILLYIYTVPLKRFSNETPILLSHTKFAQIKPTQVKIPIHATSTWWGDCFNSFFNIFFIPLLNTKWKQEWKKNAGLFHSHSLDKQSDFPVILWPVHNKRRERRYRDRESYSAFIYSAYG